MDEKEAFMNDTNPIQEENPTPPLATKNSVTGDELSPSTQEETPLEKHPSGQEIDLNELFPDAETDLNNLFPDTEVKHLLKNIVKNKKDMGSIEERLSIENEIPKKNKKKKIDSNASRSDKTESTQTD